MVLWRKFGRSSNSMREVILTSIIYGFDQKTNAFEVCSRFKFNKLGQTPGIALKFHKSVSNWKSKSQGLLSQYDVKKFQDVFGDLQAAKH